MNKKSSKYLVDKLVKSFHENVCSLKAYSIPKPKFPGLAKRCWVVYDQNGTSVSIQGVLINEAEVARWEHAGYLVEESFIYSE